MFRKCYFQTQEKSLNHFEQSYNSLKSEMPKNLINQMKKDCKTASYSISNDGSNDQGIKKKKERNMNPVTVRLFDINIMVVNQFFRNVLNLISSSSWCRHIYDGIFAAIDKAFANNGIHWDKFISLGVDNTSVNIGKHHPLITKAREKRLIK